MGITASCPLRVRYIADVDDLAVRGWITGTGYARRMTSVGSHISTLSYLRDELYTKTETSNLFEEQLSDNGGLGQSVFQFYTGGRVPKNTLSRFLGESPITVNKYSGDLNPSIHGNIGISIN